jgi:DNA-binding XRE family transcriptional regulator
VQAALVFAQQQASRYGKLAQDGWGTVQNAQQQEEAAVRTAQESLALVQRQIASLTAQRLGAEAGVAQAKAQLHQAEVNLGRTRILSPVDGYVTNLLAQFGQQRLGFAHGVWSNAMLTFDGRQLTAARALAEFTLAELAEAAGVTPRTVHRLEIGGEQHIAKKRRHGHVSRETWDRIVAALKRRGVELLPETDEHGAGVRWLLPRAQRPRYW